MSAKPKSQSSSRPDFEEMTPAQIVEHLTRHVVGQEAAKRALAVALRNRARRRNLDPEMANEVQPKNLILIGSTGVGKTELARRLAQLSQSPFLKVEASKFTEVGYVGRDVESIIDELVESAVQMVRRERASQIERRAERNAEERLLDLLIPARKAKKKKRPGGAAKARPGLTSKKTNKVREKLRRKLRAGKLDRKRVRVEVHDRITFEEVLLDQSEEFESGLAELLTGMVGAPTTQDMPVGEAIPYLIQEEEAKLLDMDYIIREALDRVEQSGIVFLDELDKIAGRERGQGPNVSREGVQRNLLPIVEGTTVHTRRGPVRTDHILFVAAGAFHVSKPSDLIPELQGRFPVRVEMHDLSESDLITILQEPEASLPKQYRALLATEGIDLVFTQEAIRKIADYAYQVNQFSENIGARRLQTVMETLLEEIAFQGGESEAQQFIIDEAYVESRLARLVKDHDLSRHIL